ncbi:putative baseplate assembly protein [Pendulispora rubella]|uniref:Baseplate assembly protein n=1 Tax=Pendulispora rubella TaxID=2741070 RepID=A0ABZ2LLF2_9BACT
MSTVRGSDLTCAVDERRQLVRDKKWNGLDYVDVVEDDPSQRTLCVHFFAEVPRDLAIANVVIEGGRRIRNIRVVSITPGYDDDPEHEECLRVVVDQAGDFSPYKLRLVAVDENGRPTGKPLPGFDVRYSSVTFSFKIHCPSDLDCAPAPEGCCDETREEPAIDYLAKDYSSFRRLILDRLALVMPEWTERHVPDVGIALVELLAYVGDHLSYYQDSVGTESYLDTARKRISVRRHARLVDYRIHEGCNARVWLVLTTDRDRTGDDALDLDDTYFVTATEEMSSFGPDIVKESALARITPNRYQCFESLRERAEKTLSLWAGQNEILFYTWGDSDCALPRGATRATLLDEWSTPEPAEDGTRARPLSSLRPGDVLLFEEVLGPSTGTPADADPLHRWFVRLTKVAPGLDELTQRHVVEIEWATEDALPFDLCVTTVLPAPECRRIENLTVARGNVLLADHGCRATDPPVVVGAREVMGTCACEGSLVDVEAVPERVRPLLNKAEPVFRQRLPAQPTSVGASKMVRQDPWAALPVAYIEATGPKPPNGPAVTSIWEPRRDLLASGRYDRHFVLEVDEARLGHVRFGDGELGAQPEVDMSLRAVYRFGNPLAGNVEAETITRIVSRTKLDGVKITVRNPRPAIGGTAPETLAHVKLAAPHAFRADLRRAITGDDYAVLAQEDPRIQRASGTLQWTGSWYEAKVAIDPLGTDEVDPALLKSIEERLEVYRRLGHDLRVVPARYVPIDLKLEVCVKPGYLRAHVKADVAARLGTGVLPGGKLGFFHADALTFGTAICPSDILSAVQSVVGVERVSLIWLRRLFEPKVPLDDKTGELELRPDEIAQLDSDPDYPEHGKLTLIMGGGR